MLKKQLRLSGPDDPDRDPDVPGDPDREPDVPGDPLTDSDERLPPEIVRLIESFGGLHYIHKFGLINKASLEHATSLKARITETYTKKAFGAIEKSFRSGPGSKEFAGLYDRVCGHLKYRIELWRFNILLKKVSCETDADADMDATKILSACFFVACATTYIRQIGADAVTFYDSPSTYNRSMLLGYAFANGICDNPDLEAECRFRNAIKGQKNILLTFKLSAKCWTKVKIRYQPKPHSDDDDNGDSDDDDNGDDLRMSNSFIKLTFGHSFHEAIHGPLELKLSYPGKKNLDLLSIYEEFEGELTSLKDTLVKCMKITDTDTDRIKEQIDTNWSRSVEDFKYWSIGHWGPLNPTAFTNGQTQEEPGSRQTPWKAGAMWVYLLQFIERYQPLVDNDTIMYRETITDLVSTAFMRETGYPFAKPPVDADGTERQIIFRSSFLDTALFV